MSKAEFNEQPEIDPSWVSATAFNLGDHPGAIVAYANPDQYSLGIRSSQIKYGFEQAVILGPSLEFPNTEVEIALFWIPSKKRIKMYDNLLEVLRTFEITFIPILEVEFGAEEERSGHQMLRMNSKFSSIIKKPTWIAASHIKSVPVSSLWFFQPSKTSAESYPRLHEASLAVVEEYYHRYQQDRGQIDATDRVWNILESFFRWDGVDTKSITAERLYVQVARLHFRLKELVSFETPRTRPNTSLHNRPSYISVDGSMIMKVSMPNQTTAVGTALNRNRGVLRIAYSKINGVARGPDVSWICRLDGVERSQEHLSCNWAHGLNIWDPNGPNWRYENEGFSTSKPFSLRVDSINGIPWPVQGENEGILELDLRLGYDFDLRITAEEQLER